VKVLGPAGAVRDLRRLAAVVRTLLVENGSDEQARVLAGQLGEYKT
jgi:hypothetical protein